LTSAANALQRLRDAVALVLHDARIILGNDDVAVYFFADDAPVPNELGAAGLPHRCDAYAFIRGEVGWTGFQLEFWGQLPPEIGVARVAETVQELVMERSVYFGQSFPPCPDHAEPLWPGVVDGRAVWRCTRGGATSVAIGAWRADP
jgi:hypothetical protein